MPTINSVEFGKIVIDNKQYNQVLIIGEEVKERDYNKLEKLFGTSHIIGDWEIKSLLESDPEIIVIATGWDGVLKVKEEAIKAFKDKGIEVICAITPEAVKTYNEKKKEGKRVNALIHTTC